GAAAAAGAGAQRRRRGGGPRGGARPGPIAPPQAGPPPPVLPGAPRVPSALLLPGPERGAGAAAVPAGQGRHRRAVPRAGRRPGEPDGPQPRAAGGRQGDVGPHLPGVRLLPDGHARQHRHQPVGHVQLPGAVPRGPAAAGGAVVCDAAGAITNVVAKFPGSCPNAAVLENSALARLLEGARPDGAWLLGDRSYPLKPWLMTPIAAPRGAAEERYNALHHQALAALRRTLALLRLRFRCLDKGRGCLQYAPQKVCQIFLACCILHNIALRRRMPLELPDGGPPPRNRARAPAAGTPGAHLQRGPGRAGAHRAAGQGRARLRSPS
uniref:Putative nuclease HARBI1 n=1 Tax=Amazona collaria TaxID=241587 RepID=A0A8B9G1F4_9PSIT